MATHTPELPSSPVAPRQDTWEAARTLWKTTWRAIWRDALLPYLFTRVVLVLVGLLATYYILPLMINNPVLPSHTANMSFPQALWLMWQRFDSGFYLDIARNGYWPASTIASHSNWVFYPLYPLLIALVALVFGQSSTAYVLAGLLIANISACIAVTYLYLLARKEFGPSVASRSVFYLALFPTAFYLSAIYTESLFLALAIACIYYARQRRWWLAGLCGGLASATRSQGFLLIIPVAWEYWQVTCDRYAPFQKQDASLETNMRAWYISRLRGSLLAARSAKNWLAALPLLLIPMGLAAFMLYAKIKTGDILATFHSDQLGWGRTLAPPGRLLIYSLLHPIVAAPLNWNFWVLNIVMAFAFLGFTVWAFRKLPTIYALYTAVMVLLPLSANLLNSIGRLYLVVFPAFLLLALWTNDDTRPMLRYLLIGTFAAFEAVFMVFFVLGLPAIA